MRADYHTVSPGGQCILCRTMETRRGALGVREAEFESRLPSGS